MHCVRIALQYSPEVADVGCTILCRLGVSSREADGGNMLRTASPVTADPALAEEAAQLLAAGGHTFFAVPVQHNGASVLPLCLPSVKPWGRMFPEFGKQHRALAALGIARHSAMLLE